MGELAKKHSKGRPHDAKDNQGKEHTDAAPVQMNKRSGDEIDEIFSSKKNKKSRISEISKDVKGKIAEKKVAVPVDEKHILSKLNNKKDDSEKRVKRSNKLPADGNLFGDSSKPRKKMNGLKIYTEEELGLNKPDAGGTPLCPFDCDCCF